jgi:pimeloyl-ACP methyl ester carboxylesterase
VKLRWLKTLSVLVVVGLLLFVFGFAPWWLGGIATTRRFTYPDKENAGLTPASFQLAYEDVTFKAGDGVPLSGWWVPMENAKGTVILVHGLNRSRIEMVRKTPFLQKQGWNALLFDLRHHGSSGGSTSSFGLLEKQDVAAASEWVRARAQGPIVYWGVSLGGATVVLAAADDPKVAGVVCDSSYRSLRDTVRHHMTLLGQWRWWARILPTGPVGAEAVYWMGKRGGFDPDKVDVQQAAARLSGRPALFVCNSGDKRMPKEIAFDLGKAAGPRAVVLVVPGNSHGGAYRDGTAAYEHAVVRVLDEAAAPALRMAVNR